MLLRSIPQLGLLALLLAAMGCKREAPRTERPILGRPPSPMFPSRAVLHERSGSGRIAFLGLDVSPAVPARGQIAEVTQYFRVEAPASGDYDVLFHAEIPGGERVIVADHLPAGGLFSTSRWRAGEIWADKDSIAVPKDVPAGALELYAGLFKGDVRLTVEAPPGGSDGEDRIHAGTLRLQGEGEAKAGADEAKPAPGEAKTAPVEAPKESPKDELPEVTVHRASGPIKADGVLDEPDWAKAEVMTFSDSMGRAIPVQFPTRLRLLYDDQNLYVAFEATDQDITERYSKRDDPIYEHEAVEVFLMPNVIAPAVGPYVELQASPGGVIFDAAFTGRRENMDVTFNAGQTVGTKIDGTLNRSDDVDRGWVSEWVVPWKGVRGVAKPPKPGDEWRLNAFRIEKYGPKERLSGEYTAWSPPRVGDFHNVARFGRMKFGS